MLEFHIKIEYQLTEERIVRGFINKDLPSNGEFLYGDEPYTWQLHGDGITFNNRGLKLNYNMFPDYGVGISFHAVSLFDFIKHSNIDWETSTEELDGLLEHLAERRLVRRMWEGYGVYGLT
jgi:hypothetical protein